MTIEMAPATPAPKAASGTESRHAKGARDKEPTKGFGAILASVDSTTQASDATAQNATVDATQGVNGANAAHGADAAAPNLQQDPTQGAALSGLQPVAAPAVPTATAADASQIPSAQGTALQGDARTSAIASSAGAKVDAAAVRSQALAGAADALAAQEGGVASETGRGTAKGGKTDKGGLSGLDSLASQSSTSSTASAKEHDAKFMATLEAMKAAQTSKDAAVAPAEVSAAAPVVSTLERLGNNEKPASRTTASDTQLSPSPLSSSGPTSTIYAPTAPGQVAPGADFQVAQQVSYWISQDVQNAELKLDGLGKSAVEVSISMSGNEAHVLFRTNEVDTRNVLESSASHLKDMLAREGVQLSGVSVGTSGSGDAQNSEGRRSHVGRRQTGLMPVAASSVEAARMRSPSTGRTLDLFV